MTINLIIFLNFYQEKKPPFLTIHYDDQLNNFLIFIKEKNHRFQQLSMTINFVTKIVISQKNRACGKPHARVKLKNTEKT